MHLHVAKSLAPDQEESDLASCMVEVSCAINLIAGYLNRAAVTYEEHASVVIRDRPEILAALYNLGGSGPKGEDEFVPDARRFGAKRRAAMAAGKPLAESSVTSSALGKWVAENLGMLNPFITFPESVCRQAPSPGAYRK